MLQQSLASQGSFEKYGRKPRRELFLDEMDPVVPWAESEALVEPHYPEAGSGLRPVGLANMLRVYFVQQWFNLSDPGVEEALYESAVLRRFVGVDLGVAPAPDETTICRFRHLLEKHELGGQMLDAVNHHLDRKGIHIATGTIVDATIIHAPSSTNNQSGERDPEMHQTRKGRQWFFGLKAHIGMDSKEGVVHSVCTSAASVADKHMLPDLLHGQERKVWGDGGYQGQTKAIREAAPQAQDMTCRRTKCKGYVEQMFSTVAIEERALGNRLVLAPVFDLSRDPRYGRVEEMYSEDPYLVAQMGTAAVRGFQGDGEILDQNHVFATAKHFVHGQPENGTNGGPSDFSEHTMRSIFLYPFEQAVEKAHIAAVMPSYNETLGGIPSNANPWLLKKVLREEWGFKGLTVSDYSAIEQLSDVHHVAGDKASAGVLAFKSGVDMELPEPSAFPGLIDAVHAGKISESELDERVGRVLTVKFNAGLFEHPLTDTTRAATEVGTPEHAKLARKVADEAIVLLKNDNHLLPLKTETMKTLAVIGPNANKERLGDYSGLPTHYVTILDGIKKRAGANTNIVYAEGCRISEPDTAPNTNAYLQYKASSPEMDERLMEQAVEVAKKADVVILALGGNEAVSREATGDSGAGYFIYGDSDSIELPGRQNELIDRISKLGKPMIAVLLNGKAYAIEQLSRQVPAIVEGWYLGQETGDAVAGVLFGDVNPSGHLPVSIARNVGQLPVYYYKTPNARLGYLMHENTPLFPFGFGLSYTDFSFGQPTVDRIYEQILNDLQSAGNAGEYYTPRRHGLHGGSHRSPTR